MAAKSVAKLCHLALELTQPRLSMTSLLMHTVAHSNRHSFSLKTNNQPIKKSCGQLSKGCQKLDVILENEWV